MVIVTIGIDLGKTNCSLDPLRPLIAPRRRGPGVALLTLQSPPSTYARRAHFEAQSRLSP